MLHHNSSKLLIFFLFFLFGRDIISHDEEFVIVICLFVVFIVLIELAHDSFDKNVKSTFFSIKTFYLKELNFYQNLSFVSSLELNEVFFFKLKFWWVYLFFIERLCYISSIRFFYYNLYFNLLVNEKLKLFLENESFLKYKVLSEKKISIFIDKVKNFILNNKKNVKGNSLNLDKLAFLITK